MIFPKKHYSQAEKDDALILLDTISKMSYDEFRAELPNMKCGKYLIMLGVLSKRGEQPFVEMKEKLHHIFIGEKVYKHGTNKIMKEREIIKKKEEFCKNNMMKTSSAEYYIVKKHTIPNNEITILGIPYLKWENGENKRRFGATVAVLKNDNPEMYRAIQARYQRFDEDKF